MKKKTKKITLPPEELAPDCPQCGKRLSFAYLPKEKLGLYCWTCRDWVSDDRIFDEHYGDDPYLEYQDREVRALNSKKL